MGKSNRLANVNEVYVHMETSRKEQSTICLWHMDGGPNGCRRQPRQRFAKVESKSNDKWWQYKNDQFKAMKDQIEDLTTGISNLCSHKRSGSRNPFAERKTHGR
jgi:hypothetical protein